MEWILSECFPNGVREECCSFSATAPPPPLFNLVTFVEVALHAFSVLMSADCQLQFIILQLQLQ
jgi:hypothetical protein